MDIVISAYLKRKDSYTDCYSLQLN